MIRFSPNLVVIFMIKVYRWENPLSGISHEMQVVRIESG